MRKRSIFVAVALLVCVPVASAADIADATTRKVEAQGLLEMDGRLRVLVVDALTQNPHQPEIEMDGESIDVELYNRRVNVSAGVAGYQSDDWTEHHHYEDAAASLLRVRDEHAFFLVPLGTAPLEVEWVGSQNTILAADGEPVEQPTFTNDPDHPPRTVPTQGSVQVDGSMVGRTVRVSGDFYISFWEADLEVRSAEGRTGHTSGSTREEVVPGTLIGASHAREMHVVVRNGSLEARFKDALVTKLFIEPDTLRVHGQALLHDAELDVDPDTEGGRESGDVQVEGDAILGPIALEPQGLHFAINGLLSGMSVDDRPLVLPSPDGDDVGSHRLDVAVTPWLAPAAVTFFWSIGIALAASLLWLFLRPPYLALQWAMDRKQYRYVLRHGGRFMVGRRAPQAAVLMAVSLLGRGRFGDATVFLQDLDGVQRPEEPTWHYLLAHALALGGALDEAGTHLRRCLALAPQYLDEVMANPVLLEAWQRSRPGRREGYS